jgi:hypothetical protein
MSDSMSLLIVGYEAGKQGVKLILNKPGRLKTGNVSNTEVWVSWDKIGAALLADYCDDYDLSRVRKMRGEEATNV